MCKEKLSPKIRSEFVLLELEVIGVVVYGELLSFYCLGWQVESILRGKEEKTWMVGKNESAKTRF